MSQFRHLLVISLIFANYQFTKSKDVLKPPELDTAKFSFNNAIINGSLTLKISMEKAECVNDRVRVPPAPEDLIPLETGPKVLGGPKNPAKSCSDLEEPGTLIDYFINTSTNPIKVACNDKLKTTCLIVKDRIEEESALNSTAITLGEELWLSQTTFDVESLYNKVEGPTGTDIVQISHLLSTSVKVIQTIKYYYSEGNSTTVNDTNVSSLKALLWNDHLVGSTITKQMPFAFSASETKPCWEGEENTEGWMCTTIHFDATSTNRLPVRDFYIEDIRKREKVQKLYFELNELCFYY